MDDKSRDPHARGDSRPSAVESTRRLLLGLAVASLALVLPTLLGRGSGGVPADGLAALVLAVSWWWGYHHGKVWLGLDMADATALFVLTSSSPAPSTSFAIAFGAVWFRSQYGSGRRLVVRVGLYSAALVGASAWVSLLDMPGFAVGSAVGVVPLLVATGAAGWRLHGILTEHDTLTRLVAVRARLGAVALGEHDDDAIRALVRECLAAVCTAAAGVRVLVAELGDGRLRGTEHYGHWATPVGELAAGLLESLPPLSALGVVAPGASPSLDRLAGTPSRWAVLEPARSANRPKRVLVLGATCRVREEVAAAAVAAVEQVRVALDAVAVRRDLALRAATDALTGLANRTTFFEALSRAQATAEATSVLYVDLDGFKTVNDTHGHDVGDEVLRHTASRLRGACRDGDTCARLGGDEFAVVLPDTAQTVAEAVARRVEAVMAAPIITSAGTVLIGASCGTALVAVHDDDPVGRADAAMYARKTARRTAPPAGAEVLDPAHRGARAPTSRSGTEPADWAAGRDPRLPWRS